MFAARFRPGDGALVVETLVGERHDLAVVDVRTGRQVGPSRRLTDAAGALAGSPDGMRFVGLAYT